MPRRLASSLLVAFVLQLGCGPCPAAEVPLAGDLAAGQVWDVFSAWLSAYEKGDVPQIMAIFDKAVVFESQSAPDEGWDDLQRDFRSDMQTRKPGTRWVPRVEEVRAEGRMAIVRAVWDLHEPGADGRDVVRESNRSLDVFVQREGRWVILRSINFADRRRGGAS